MTARREKKILGQVSLFSPGSGRARCYPLPAELTRLFALGRGKKRPHLARCGYFMTAGGAFARLIGLLLTSLSRCLGVLAAFERRVSLFLSLHFFALYICIEVLLGRSGVEIETSTTSQRENEDWGMMSMIVPNPSVFLKPPNM